MMRTPALPKAGPAPRSAPPPVDAPVAAALHGFELDPSRSYTGQVHDLLRDAIVRGTLPPRTALSEATISKLIDLSRTPVG